MVGKRILMDIYFNIYIRYTFYDISYELPGTRLEMERGKARLGDGLQTGVDIPRGLACGWRKGPTRLTGR